MNSISHLDKFITRSLSPSPSTPSPSATSRRLPLSIHSSRSLPPSPAFSSHPTLPVRRRASVSDTSRRRKTSPSDPCSSTSVFSDDKKADRKRRKSARARWLILKLVAKVWSFLVGMLFVFGMAGRSVKKGRGRSAVSVRLNGEEQVDEPQLVEKDAELELEDDQVSVASSREETPPLVNGLSPPLMDTRTQSIEFDPRTQALDPSQFPYPPPPPLSPSILHSPKFEFSPPAPDAPSPTSAPARPVTRSRLLLLPNPLAESSGNSLLHPSIPHAPSTPPADSSPYINAPLRKKTPFHKPKTLILDLDETLIHSTSRSSGANGAGRKGEGHMVEVFLGGRSTVYHVYKRPYVDYFLKKVSPSRRHMSGGGNETYLMCLSCLQVSSWYTLVIFTASMQEYADPVIDWLDGGRGMFGKRLFRDVSLCVSSSVAKLDASN